MPSYLCVDASNQIHRLYHGMPEMVSRKTGKVTHALYGWIHLLAKVRQRIPFLPADVTTVVFFDSKREVNPDAEPLGFEYKGNRKPADEALIWQLKMCRKVTPLMGVKYCEMPGMEADHLLGSFVLSKRNESKVFILSSDKDMLQLVGGNVWAVKQGNSDFTLMDTAAVKLKWGVEPNQIADLLTMMGDTSDNIPGVPGIGIKTAQKLLAEHGSLDGVLAALPTMKAGKIRSAFEETLPQIPAIRALTEFHPLPGLNVHSPTKDYPFLCEVLRQLEMYKTISLFQ